MEILPREHWLKSRVIQTVKEMLKKTDHMRDAQEALPEEDKEAVRRIKIHRDEDGRRRHPGPNRGG